MKYSKHIENRCIYQNTKLFKKIEGISYSKLSEDSIITHYCM